MMNRQENSNRNEEIAMGYQFAISLATRQPVPKDWRTLPLTIAICESGDIVDHWRKNGNLRSYDLPGTGETAILDLELLLSEGLLALVHRIRNEMATSIPSSSAVHGTAARNRRIGPAWPEDHQIPSYWENTIKENEGGGDG